MGSASDIFSAGSVSKGLDTAIHFYDVNEAGNEAHEGRQWAQDMRGTAYQATVADLKKAGLNPMLAYGKGPSAAPSSGGASIPSGSGESLASASAHTSQVDLTKAQTRNVNAEADRNEQIAAIMKQLGPNIVRGLGAVESSAAGVGTAAGQAVDAIRKALEGIKLPEIPSGPDLPGFIKDVTSRLLPDVSRLPGAALVEKAKDIISSRSRMPAAAKDSSFGSGAYSTVWGKSEYERAQDERFRAARQSPASRRRSGGR